MKKLYGQGNTYQSKKLLNFNKTLNMAFYLTDLPPPQLGSD